MGEPKEIDIVDVVKSIRGMIADMKDGVGLANKTTIEKINNSYTSLRESVAKCTRKLDQVDALDNRIRVILGGKIRIDNYDKFDKELIPDLSLSDAEYFRRFSAVFKHRSGAEMMNGLNDIITSYISDLQSNMRKLDKINERIAINKDRNNSNNEEDNTVSLQYRMRMVCKTIAYRIKFCAKKFLECRRKHLNRILGMTETMYRMIGDAPLNDIIDPNRIDDIMKSLVGMDNRYSGKKD